MEKYTLTRKEEIKRVIPLANDRQLPLTRPLVMGVLNVTPDSFSDGGLFEDTDDAVRHALDMIAQGADIIDIGGESSRPGAEPVEATVEINRVVPVIIAIRRQTDACISIDTCHAETARAALDAGVDIINDISALRFDSGMAPLAAEREVPVVLMHMKGTPRDMQADPSYVNVIEEIAEFFRSRMAYAMENGIRKNKLILDPGIGFGKRLSDNLELLRNLSYFRSFNLPLMVGASRKSFIRMLNPTADNPAGRLGGSLAAAIAAVNHGADIVRVHDVAETIEGLKVNQAVKSDA